jgi:hypothetical protein
VLFCRDEPAAMSVAQTAARLHVPLLLSTDAAVIQTAVDQGLPLLLATQAVDADLALASQFLTTDAAVTRDADRTRFILAGEAPSAAINELVIGREPRVWLKTNPYTGRLSDLFVVALEVWLRDQATGVRPMAAALPGRDEEADPIAAHAAVLGAATVTALRTILADVASPADRARVVELVVQHAQIEVELASLLGGGPRSGMRPPVEITLASQGSEPGTRVIYGALPDFLLDGDSYPRLEEASEITDRIEDASDAEIGQALQALAATVLTGQATRRLLAETISRTSRVQALEELLEIVDSMHSKGVV